MADNAFMRVEEVTQELGVSVSYAYRIIQKLNAEMREKGYGTDINHRASDLGACAPKSDDGWLSTKVSSDQ